MSPPRGGNMPSTCKKIPQTLSDVLPKSVKPGGNVPPTPCKRFNYALGARACRKQKEPDYCSWTWHAKACEGDPPGEFYNQACSPDLNETCQVWEQAFSTKHPTKNCDIVYSCAGDPNQCYMVGQVVLNVTNETEFTANKSVTEAALKAGLAKGFKVPPGKVDVLQVCGWAYNFPNNLANLAKASGVSSRKNDQCEVSSLLPDWCSDPQGSGDGSGYGYGDGSQYGYGDGSQYGYDDGSQYGYYDGSQYGYDDNYAAGDPGYARRMQEDHYKQGSRLGEDYSSSGSVVNDGVTKVKFVVSKPPASLLPEVVPARGHLIIANINQQFQVGNTTPPLIVANATFTPWPPAMVSQKEYSTTLIALQAEVSRADDGSQSDAPPQSDEAPLNNEGTGRTTVPSQYAPLSNEQIGTTTLLKRGTPFHEEHLRSTTSDMPVGSSSSDMPVGADSDMPDSDMPADDDE